LKTLITGGRGLIGSHLQRALWAGGNSVTLLTRRPGSDQHVLWDPARGILDPTAVEGFDCVVHLSGETIQGRWTAAKKQRIMGSRVDSTRLRARTLANARLKPKVRVCASGSNCYGPGGPWDESGPRGDSFLSEVCACVEAAAEPAQMAGIRVVHARIGGVLTPDGGALKAMLPTFRLGLGGYTGDGLQRVSWIHVGDMVAALLFILGSRVLEGPVNVVSPRFVSNRDFAAALGAALGRPTPLPLPAPVMRLMFSQMAEEVILRDNAVVPRKLREAGFRWSFENIRSAFDNLLEK